MGMNQTPAGERVHISFFGRRNVGKSSVINAVTGQSLAIVSAVKGTTTDPVYKSMELLPLGPVMLIDTPGIDDEGELGQLRVKKSYQVLNKTDIALLVLDASVGKTVEEEALIERFQKKEIPYLLIYNKVDLLPEIPLEREREIWISATENMNIYALKEKIAKLRRPRDDSKKIIGEFLRPFDTVVLVIPIDKAAPKGRLILPQQQTIRDILEAGANCLIARDTELKETLEKLEKPPALVVTDSQAFAHVSKIVPDEIPFTSFSILFARYKGDLSAAVQGAACLSLLQNHDRVLICEGCTHHRQCDDIGTVKMPGWITAFTKKKLEFSFTSGTEFPEDLSPYQLVVHCGGCMLNEREMKYRVQCAKDQQIPMTNYGILIAHTQGILERSVRLFPTIHALLG